MAPDVDDGGHVVSEAVSVRLSLFVFSKIKLARLEQPL